MTQNSDSGGHSWPVEAVAALESALVYQNPGMGNPPAHIKDLYTPTGQAIVILSALAKAGFDIRTLSPNGSSGAS